MGDEVETNPEEEIDIQFAPIIELKPVEVKTLEDEEEEIFTMRAKLFRFDTLAEPHEWKERGVGDIRILKNRKTSQIRLLMRREKVLKICCNHFLTEAMKLKPHADSERAFVWSTLADYADEESRQELLAIRFRDAENAQKFKSKFEELQKALPDCNGLSKDSGKEEKKEGVETTVLTKKLNDLSVGDKNSTGDS